MTDEKPEYWVTKVHRNGGGTSILDIADKDRCQALADEFNTQYQTDNYFIEPYKEELHAYSRHGEPDMDRHANN